MGTKDAHLCSCGHIRSRHNDVCHATGCSCGEFTRKGLSVSAQSRQAHNNKRPGSSKGGTNQ